MLSKRRRVLWFLAIVVVQTLLSALLPPAPFVPQAPEMASAQVTSTPSTLLAPETLYSNGARLRWTRYETAAGASFGSYELHRSTSASFTPSSSTLIATLGDQSTTSYRDTTAAPSKSFTYKLVANGEASNAQTVTLPAAGKATKTLQPAASEGTGTWLKWTSGSTVCTNNGTGWLLRVGTTSANKYRSLLRFDLRDIPTKAAISSAKLSLHYDSAPETNPGQLNLHRVKQAWLEGPGNGCSNGANWYESQAGVDWSNNGGDIPSTADFSLASKSRSSTGGWDSFTVTPLVQKWINADAANHGLLLKLADETLVSGKEVDYDSDDATDATVRPKLEITYADDSKAEGPRVAISSPAPGSRVTGSALTVSAAASDDSRVTRVDFFADGATTPFASDTTAPYQGSWNLTGVGNGSHSLTARATDDAGNTTTIPAADGTKVTVDNSPGPSTSISSPTGGSTVKGVSKVSATATPPSGETITKVEFYFDDNRFGEDTEVDATANTYSASWDTLDPLLPAYDGSHVLTVKAYDSSGNVTTSAATTVTVVNSSGTQYKATIDLNAAGTQDDDASVPDVMLENKNSGVTEQDPYDSTSGGRSISSPPQDSTSTMTSSTSSSQPLAMGATFVTSTCPAAAFCPDVTVTNNSGVAWKGGVLRLWYRWIAPNGAILFEGPTSSDDYFPQTVQPGQSKTFPLTIYPPALPPGADLGEYELRLDLYNTDPDDNPNTNDGTWFAAKGNRPVANPVIVNKELDSALGLERYYHYDAEPVGGSMTRLTNVANGNMLLRYSPFFAPGRGLSTMVDLTYNSLEDHSESPVGNNFSLSMSGLTRFGNPIDIHPNKADQISGHSNRYITFTDGDGTTHRFDGEIAADGTLFWKEPAGVHLYLRQYETDNPDTYQARKWAFTRPDRVTYFFDEDGYPTFVKDRNGNELKFTLQDTPAGEDPGGPKKRITAVTDAGGRSFSIDYYEKAEAPKPQIRGNIQTISDHSGSKLDFDYYDDGNLLRITQRGGTNADGSYLADRSIVFTYTTSDGVSPAATNLLNPSPKTPNQSTRIYSVADPLKNKTTFNYYGPSEGPHLRWKLQSVTNRTADKTSYSYDIDLRKTTVTKPLGRVSTYNYDTDGKLTSMLDPLNRQTSLTWSSDFHVTQVAEPGAPARSTSYTYNNNGYVTSYTDQEGNRTELAYQNVAADSADPLGLRDKSPYWKSGRSIPHVSQLIRKTDPKGVGNADPDDYQWNFTYDSRGNLLKVIEPEPTVNPVGERYATVNSYNADGTLLKTTDPNGNPTSFEAYDANGFPTRIVDAESRTTQFFYDDDGLLRWIQDPRHLNDSGGDERSYRIFFDYDSFHRLGRQSAPKSTAASRGLLIWSGAQYDANDNLKVQIDPHYGRDYPGTGSQSKVDYDAMDRPTVAVNQEGDKTGFTYDDAGRLVIQTAPKGWRPRQSTRTLRSSTTTTCSTGSPARLAMRSTGPAVTETRTTLSCYDLAGDLTAMTAPRADRTSIPCPPDGVPFTWRYEYDKAHRVVKSIDPKGNARTQHYDPNGAVDFATNENTDRSEFFYDQRGLPIKSVEPFKPDTNRTVTTMSVYDGAGNLTKSISLRAYGASADKQSFTEFVTTYHYDRVNQVVKVELPTRKDDLTTVSVNEAEQAYVHNSYDDNGNLRWTSLPTTEGNPALVTGTAKTEMTYFDPGWIKTSTDNVNPNVHFDYTAQGWQRERTPELKSDPGNLNRDRTLTWSYYPDGLLKERIDPDGQRSTFDYDPNDNLLEAVDAAASPLRGRPPWRSRPATTASMKKPRCATARRATRARRTTGASPNTTTTRTATSPCASRTARRARRGPK